jgi:phospholipid/cholesterol/gamma-HCH transport system ATP-binding protein
VSDSDDSIIQVRNLRTAYGDQVVHDDLSFDVARGSVFAILGGSGCGKSTLMKHMIGLHEPALGKILIDGEDIGTATGPARRKLLRKIGVSYQGGAMFGSMTVQENVRLVLEEFTRLPSDAMDLIARMRLQLVGLGDDGGKMPSELSGGMLKRAAIARAMALDPEIVFLDEPSAGLDPVTAAGLDELILRLSRSLHLTFVIVTHELASIMKIADEVILLSGEAQGIVATGSPGDLMQSRDPQVSRFFHRQAAAHME